ncbi:MFS transporter [Streptomyces rimosus]|uniref:MFS transporter n=1 Tax=Streptomyces rimosus TaxID=1927 RepID=UPI0006B2610C|nr:MFS transporter [Streptomyces rimosus]
MVVACTTQFVVVLDVSVVHVALPSIRVALGFGTAGLQWVVTGYMLAFGGALLLGGRLADLYGTRRVLMCGLTVFVGAALVAGLAWRPEVLVLARAVQGVGAAALSPVSLTLLTRELPGEQQRARALAVWGGVAAAAGAAGVFVGGLVTEFLDWRWTMLLNVPVGVALYPMARLAVPRRPASGLRRSPDVVGALSVTAALGLCVYGALSTDMVPLSAGGILLCAALLWEGKGAKDPLLPLTVLRSRPVAGANTAMFLTASATFSMWYFLSLYLQNERNFSPLATGMAFLPQYLAVVGGAQLAPGLIRAYGLRRVLLVGSAMQCVGFIWLAGADGHASFLSHILLPGFLITFALGISSTPLTLAATGGIRAADAGLASGLVNTARHLGGAVGVAALAAIANRSGALAPVFRIDAALLAVTAALALALPTSPVRTARAPSTTERDSGTERTNRSDPA